MIRVPLRVVQCDEAAERSAEHDRMRNADRVAQAAHVVRPRIEIPIARAATVAPAMSALVVVDDLCDLGQGREDRLLERAVVDARSSVQHDDRGALAHRTSVGDECRPADVNEKPHIANRHLHKGKLTELRGSLVRDRQRIAAFKPSSLEHLETPRKSPPPDR